MREAQSTQDGQDNSSQPHARVTSGSITVAGRKRDYTIAAPTDADPDRLLLIFHGSNQTGAKFRAFTGNSFDALAGTGRTAVTYLDGYQGHWNDARKSSSFAARTENIDDVAFTKAMIDMLADNYQVDRSKVYVAGYSNGGQMVIRLIHEVPELLAGAAVMSAAQPAPENFMFTGAPAAPLPVLLVHGTRDAIVAYSGGKMSLWARVVFRVGGLAMSAEQTAAYFAARNDITVPPTTTKLPHRAESGNTSVIRTDYQQSGKSPVALYSVHGGGHTIPGPTKAPFILGRTNRDMNAAEAIGGFFGLTRPEALPLEET